MKKVNVLFGTVYGSAQSVAETIVAKLNSLEYQTRLWQANELDEYIPVENELLILVSATTGQGDLPDDILPWFEKIKQKCPYLPNLNYGVIGLGDSSYETFCGAAKQLDLLFSELGATALVPKLEIDAMETMEPEVDALNWLKNWHQTVLKLDLRSR